MNRSTAIRCASVPRDHRLGVDDGKTVLIAAQRWSATPPLPLDAHAYSRPIGTILSAKCSADLIRTVPIDSAAIKFDSNPHSASAPLLSYQGSRGFLPRGLSDAYRRPR